MKNNTILRFGTLDSTNLRAASMVASGELNEGTVIIAHEQTQGRGLDLNTWESEPGKNLTMSMVLYPRFLPAGRQFELSKVIALGLHKTVADLIPESYVTIKWPNDIYIDDRKVAGILIQNGILGHVLDSSIAGIGLNVNQIEFKSNAPNPVSLRMISGIEYDLDRMLDKLINNIDTYYEMIRSGRFDEMDKLYINYLYRFNVTGIFMKDGRKIQARITGVNEYGYLLLETSEGKRVECEIKEVEFII